MAFAADVWSMGVILFELLTLVKPFAAANLGALVRKIEKLRVAANAEERSLGVWLHRFSCNDDGVKERAELVLELLLGRRRRLRQRPRSAA